MNIYKDAKATLNEIISKSDLQSDDKNLWNKVIDQATVENMAAILDIVSEDDKALILLTENLKQKVQAIEKMDGALWQNIIDEEVSFLENQ